MRSDIRMAAPVLFALLGAACTSAPREGASASASPSQPPVIERAPTTTNPAAMTAGPGSASAQVSPTQGNQAHGTVTFEPDEGGLKVTIHLEGLPPGEHGFHLHEKGDCSAPDASSAGDHWNPTHQPHGAPDAMPHHAGDLGNITADASGKAHVTKILRGLGLSGDQSVVGHAVVVHAKADDFKTQPSGDSGPRIACGVVVMGSPATR